MSPYLLVLQYAPNYAGSILLLGNELSKLRSYLREQSRHLLVILCQLLFQPEPEVLGETRVFRGDGDGDRAFPYPGRNNHVSGALDFVHKYPPSGRLLFNGSVQFGIARGRNDNECLLQVFLKSQSEVGRDELQLLSHRPKIVREVPADNSNRSIV